MAHKWLKRLTPAQTRREPNTRRHARQGTEGPLATGWADVTRTILLTPSEPRVAEDRPDCCWLYVVTGCLPAEGSAQAGDTTPQLQEPIKDPARFEWHEVTKVAHYYPSVDAMTRPMQVREDGPLYRPRSGSQGEDA